MIKKVGVLLLALFLFSYVIALDEPQISQSQKDAEQLQGVIDDYTPIDDNGKLDISNYKPIKSGAEKKIDEINAWLENNASWLKIVFGMVPALTFLFFTNFYLMLLLFTALFLNADATIGFIPHMDKEIEGLPIKLTPARILGLTIFIILIATKVIVALAKVLSDFAIFQWHKAWEVATPIATILLILAIIGLIVLAIKFPGLLKQLNQIRKMRKEAKASQKEGLNRQALDTLVKAATNKL